MPFQKGRQKTGGRQKGSRDKRNRIRRSVLQLAYESAALKLPEALREGISPLEGMMVCLLWSLAERDRAGVLAAAAALAPYCHPRLQTTNVTVRNAYDDLSDEELAQRIAELETKEREAAEAEELLKKTMH